MMPFSEPENDHVMGWSSGLVVRPAVSPKVGMPRPTAALRRVVWLSIWASLMFAPARSILEAFGLAEPAVPGRLR